MILGMNHVMIVDGSNEVDGKTYPMHVMISVPRQTKSNNKYLKKELSQGTK